MAHEKAIREATKALELGYSEKDAANLLKARGLDKDEIKKELPNLTARKLAKDAKKAAAEKKSGAETKAATLPSTQKESSLWLGLLILALIVLIIYLFYTGVLSTEMLNMKNFR